MTVGYPAVGHEPPHEAVQHVLNELLAAPGDVVQGHRRRQEDQQPERLAVFRPGGLIGVQQGAAQNRQDEFLFSRRHRRAGFVERPMDRADT